MAKRLLLSVLVEVLGAYVEGLTVENLKLGVWSGKIELNNLSLKRNALDGLNLPISISHGTLNHLSVKIPWTALESKPVRIEIDGLYLQAGPLDLSKLTAEDIRKSILIGKRAKLQEAEDYILLNGEINKDSKEDGKSSSYFRSLGMKIVDNIEIVITNIHIRYEDNRISIPNKCLSAGMTIGSIKLATTDDQWKEAFVIRGAKTGKDQISDIIRKLGILEDLSVYWNVDDNNPMENMTPEIWLSNMKAMIFSNSQSNQVNPFMNKLDYIIAPPDQLTLKIIHRDKSTLETPKLDLTVSSSTIRVHFDRTQYQQILGVIATFSQLERYKQMSVYRPRVRPTQDARAWWKYAYKLVLGKDLSVGNKFETMIKCKRKRERYMQLLKSAKKSKIKNPNVEPAESIEIAEIEESLPFDSLLIFRKLAAVEMLKEKMDDKGKKTTLGYSKPKEHDSITASDYSKSVSEISSPSSSTQKSMSSFFSWGKKPASAQAVASKSPVSTTATSKSSTTVSSLDKKSDIYDDEMEDMILIEKIQLQLQVDDSVADEFPVRLSLEASTEVFITSSKQPIIDITMGMRADVEVKPQRVFVAFALGNMKVEDKYTMNPTEKYLMKPQISSNSKNPQQFQVMFESLPSTFTSSLTFVAIPMDITFNSECFQKLLEIFLYQPPVIQTATAKPTKSQILAALSNYAKEVTSGTNAAGTMALNVRIESPTIILPRNPKSDNEGYLLLDCGNFNLYGKISASGVKLDTKVTGINIGMPDNTQHRYDLQTRGQYLVNPFDVGLVIQNFDKSKAELTLAFDITPSIKANIDVIKLRRFMAVILKVINTITQSTTFLKDEAVARTEDLRTTLVHRQQRIELGKDVGNWLVGDNNLENKSDTSMSALKGSSSIEMGPLNVEQRKDLYLSISIPTVVICLSISDNHTLDCIVDSSVVGVLLSSFETTVTLSLKAVTINDSMRPKNFTPLVWTPATESKAADQSNLFRMSMIFFSSKDSVQYRGYGSEISIDLLRLGLDLDDKAILRLCPFFRKLTENLDNDVSSSSLSVKRNSVDPSRNSIISSNAPQVSADFLSLRLDISITKVMLNMLQPRKQVSFERVFALNIIGFVLQYEFIDKADMKMGIQTIDALDTRHESESYFYKSIFCRSQLASEYGSTITQDKGASRNDDWMKLNSNLTADKDDKIFYMTYVQEGPTVANIDITVQDITSFISPDSLMTFINILLANINALIQMIGALTGSGKKKVETDDTSFTTKLLVTATNPRLIVLEDPREENSQAIVSKCGISLYYIIDTSNGVTTESMHLSLKDAEIFVLQGLSVGFPQQIVDPTSIEFHMKRSMEKSIILAARFAINIDSINTKLSFHDLILMNAIINRTIDIASNMDVSAEDSSTVTDQKEQAFDPETRPANLTMYDVMIQIRSVYLTIINDYGQQNVPVLRFQLLDSQVQSSGAVVLMNGDASFTISAEYYNSRVTCYEPILEPWCPQITLTTDLNGFLVEIVNENTLQLDVSGALAKSLIDCSYLFETASKEYKRYYSKSPNMHTLSPSNSSSKKLVSTVKAPTVPHELSTRLQSTLNDKIVSEDKPVTFINTLGIPIDIIENSTKILVSSLPEVGRQSIDRTTLQSVYQTAKNFSAIQLRSREISGRLPNLYDIYLKGDYEQIYLPLFQLPLHVNVARHYYLQFKAPTSASETPTTSRSQSMPLAIESGGSRSSITRKSPSAATSFLGESIVEEVYQNSRYDVVNRKWSKTWYKYGDPDEWTDRKNNSSTRPQEKSLPTDQWEWVEPEWRVDMDGVIGKDIDEEGYEYNINFNNFNFKKRRTFQPLDSVRRRRWIRTRRLKMNLQTVPTSDTSPRSPARYRTDVASKRLTPNSSSSNLSDQGQSVDAGSLLTVFWDVQLQPDGSRHVILRSGFIVTNSLPFPIEIRLSGYVDTLESFIFGPIAVGESFYVPLQRIHAKSIEIRPISDKLEYEWCTSLDCRIRDASELKPHEAVQLYFVDCTATPSSLKLVAGDEQEVQRSFHGRRVFMRTSIDFTSDKGVKIDCMPFAILYNRLPSSFVFKCVSDDNREHGVISPASQHPMVYVNPTVEPKISYQMGSYVWSTPQAFITGTHTVDLISPFKATEGINLTMNVSVNSSTGLVECYLYSKYSLIDRTGLKMSIRTRRFNEKQINYDLAANNSSFQSAAAANMNTVVGSTMDVSSSFMEVGNTIERRTYEDSNEPLGMDPSSHWITGGSGVTLFQSATDSAILGLNHGKVWSFSISLISLGSNTNSLEVMDKEAKKVYQLAYKIVPMPYIFQETNALIVTPWYRIVNCMDEDIEIRQVESDKALRRYGPPESIPSFSSEGWHRSDSIKDTKLQFRTPGSLWSLGIVDINEIGSSILLVPSDPAFHPKGTSNTGTEKILLHIEVKFAEVDDLSYMTMLIWKETTEQRDKWTISVKNEANYPITLRQDLKGLIKDQETLSLYEMCIEPGQWIPFGWADQSISSTVHICIGTTMVAVDDNLCTSIDLLKLGEPVILPLDIISPNESMILIVQAVGSGKVLNISTSYKSSKELLSDSGPSQPYRKEMKLFFRSLGVSLIAERPVRREFMSLYLEEIEANIIMKGSTQTESGKNFFEFKIHDIQIDNYSETAVYPVLLHSYDSATRKKASKRARYKKKSIHANHAPLNPSTITAASLNLENDTPETLHFFQFSVVQEKPIGLDTAIFKYVALRILEIKVALDSSSIQLYLLDIHNDLIGETMNQDQFKGLSATAMSSWVDSYNTYITTQVKNPVDPIAAKKLGQAYKIYVETLAIHPIKITASFMTTPFPREQKYDIFASKKYKWLQMIRGIAGKLEPSLE